MVRSTVRAELVGRQVLVLRGILVLAAGGSGRGQLAWQGQLLPVPAAVRGEGLVGLGLPLLTLLIQVTAVAGLVRWGKLPAQPLAAGMVVGQVAEPADNFSPAQPSSLSLLPPACLSAKPELSLMPFTADWKVVEVVGEPVR